MQKFRKKCRLVDARGTLDKKINGRYYKQNVSCRAASILTVCRRLSSLATRKNTQKKGKQV